ncbi:unnamed protein product [Camellia sinensis]|uniref:phosphopantothenoylcysteine decarboxylase subunit VHS3-like n=1 Tax=Camellia sinensis TaxID=4442 RepID=UPI0010357BD1|nr:phosphopantothenoylcysteine decarboxylase subunit VHS3-like [Camellia sinensis]
MDEMNVVDVSSFMLLEATGDSEVDSELNMDVAADHDADDDDDDAQSCSCDLLDYCGPEFDYDHLGNAHDQDLHFDDDDDEGEVIDQDWTDDDNDDDDQVGLSSTAKAGLHKKSSVDSNMELMNEMEKNRLFWEACLAS